MEMIGIKWPPTNKGIQSVLHAQNSQVEIFSNSPISLKLLVATLENLVKGEFLTQEQKDKILQGIDTSELIDGDKIPSTVLNQKFTNLIKQGIITDSEAKLILAAKDEITGEKLKKFNESVRKMLEIIEKKNSTRLPKLKLTPPTLIP